MIDITRRTWLWSLFNSVLQLLGPADQSWILDWHVLAIFHMSGKHALRLRCVGRSFQHMLPESPVRQWGQQDRAEGETALQWSCHWGLSPPLCCRNGPAELSSIEARGMALVPQHNSVPGEGQNFGPGAPFGWGQFLNRGYPSVWASLVTQLVKNPPAMKEAWVGKIPWKTERLPTPVFRPRDCKELDTTERLSLHPSVWIEYLYPAPKFIHWSSIPMQWLYLEMGPLRK